MNDRHLTVVGGWRGFFFSCLMATLALGGFLDCQAQQTLFNSVQSPAVSDPLRQVSWISGPKRISLGNIADIDLPSGYRLTGEQGARVILEGWHTAVPDDLIGMVVADSGGWSAVLEYRRDGYFRNPDAAQINASKILQEVRKQVDAQPDSKTSSTLLSWQSPPVYDDASHSLAWSFLVQSGEKTLLNEDVAFLGRHGALVMTSVQPYPATDTSSLKALAGSINFKSGQQYADYQSGDKIAGVGLGDVIVGRNEAASTLGTGMAVGFIYGGFALLLCVVFGYLMVRRRKNHRVSARVPVRAAANWAPVKKVAVEPAAAVAPQAAIVAKNGGTNGNGHNGNGLPERRHLHRARRKKVFDYPKFYTSVMRELSLHSYGSGIANPNGKAKTNGHANGGSAAPISNGHTNGNGSSVNETIKSEIVELITTQKNLIQEQKCLLEQQTRLIEEKRWLIEEQTAFLKNHSVLNEDQYPLKLE